MRKVDAMQPQFVLVSHRHPARDNFRQAWGLEDFKFPWTCHKLTNPIHRHTGRHLGATWEIRNVAFHVLTRQHMDAHGTNVFLMGFRDKTSWQKGVKC